MQREHAVTSGTRRHSDSTAKRRLVVGLVACVVLGGTAVLGHRWTGSPEPSSNASRIWGAPWPHEPPGFRVITDFAFEQLAGGGWQQTAQPPAVAIVADSTAPASPPFVLQFLYPVGFVAGVGPGNAYYDIPEPWPTALYIGFWWKPSNPWQGHQSTVNKILFVTTGGTQQAAILELRGVDAGPFDTQVVCEFPWGTQNLLENRNPGFLALGEWHRMELYLNYRGGILRWWVDGVLKGDYGQLAYPFMGFDGFKFQPTWGGVGGANKIEADYYRIDHVRASQP